MATTHHTSIQTDSDSRDASALVLLAAYAGSVLASVALATGAALVLASFTGGLGGFVLLAAGWLGAVSASPAIAARATERIAEIGFGQGAARPTRAVNAVVTYLVAK